MHHFSQTSPRACQLLTGVSRRARNSNYPLLLILLWVKFLSLKTFSLWDRTCKWGAGWCKEILLAVIIPLIESAGQNRASILWDPRQLANWKGAVRQSSLGVHLQIIAGAFRSSLIYLYHYCSPGGVLYCSNKYLFVQRRKGSVLDHFKITKKTPLILNLWFVRCLMCAWPRGLAVTSDPVSLDPLLSIPSPAWSDIYYHPAMPSDADIDYPEMMGEMVIIIIFTSIFHNNVIKISSSCGKFSNPIKHVKVTWIFNR